MGIDEISIPTSKEIEADGFITPPSALERKSESKAKPMSECLYPKCEECDNYHGHYCTVPMVVSKQDWLSMHDWAQKTTNRICDLEKLVTDEILGSKYDEEVFTVYEWEDEYGHQCFPLTYEDAKNLEADGIQLNAVGEISSDML